MGWTKRNVERIAKLTPSQESRLIEFREKWNGVATSTEPFDTDAAADGIKRFTKENGRRRLKSYTTKWTYTLGFLDLRSGGGL